MQQWVRVMCNLLATAPGGRQAVLALWAALQDDLICRNLPKQWHSMREMQMHAASLEVAMDAA
jgi:hypothetical protein